MWRIGKIIGRSILTRKSQTGSGRERRQFPRVAIGLQVSICRFRGDPPDWHLAVDVSDGGMLVTPNLYGSASEQVLVTCDRFGETVQALIAGQRTDGTALVFSSPPSGRRLAHWLRQRAGGSLGIDNQMFAPHPAEGAD